MSRSRRSKSQVSAAAEGVSILDKLVLAQAVWEVGTSSWLKISRILGKHPLLSHPKTFFTAQSCHAMYNHMMKECGFELSDANNVIQAPTHHKLAEKYWNERIEELRTLIGAEEQQFKGILAEINQIRAGQRDEEIKARITGTPGTEKEADTPVEEPGDITPEQDVPADAVGATPKDEAQEVEMPAIEPEPEIMQQEEPTVDIPAVPPTPEVAMEDVSQQEGTKTPAEATPAPDAPLSPAENLDHLMQVSDDEKQDVEVPDLVPEEPVVDEPAVDGPAVDEPAVDEPAVDEAAVDEQGVDESTVDEPAVEEPAVEEPAVEEPAVGEPAVDEPAVDEPAVDEPAVDEPAVDAPAADEPAVDEPAVDEPAVDEPAVDVTPEKAASEEAVAPAGDTEPTTTTDDVKAEPAETPIEEDMDETQSKPVSRASESGPAAEESISTRRSTRRRPSVSTSATPVPSKKRGRRAKTPEAEAEAEQESTLAPTVKEATPVVEETQPEEEMPMSAAARRRDGKRKASFFGGVDSPRAAKRAREESEPVDDDEQGSTSTVRRRPTGRTEEQVALKRFQTVITMVHSQISQHRNGNIFHNPIKVSEAPDYHDIVKRPIDLKTIKAKIKDGVIGNSLEYQRDIYLMFANAMMYNRPGSDVHVMAEDMMVESDSHINTFRQTEGYVKSR